MTRSTPRALICPRSMARSSGASAPGAGRNRRRSSLPGSRAFSRHGVPASRAPPAAWPAATRAATTALGSANCRSLSSSARPTGRNSTFTSTRSSSGPDSLARYRRRASGVQVQRRPRPPPSARTGTGWPPAPA